MFEASSEKPGVLKDCMVFQRTRMNSLADIKQLNMWGHELIDVSLVKEMPNLECVSLPVNLISEIHHFSSCKKLKTLLLRQNKISDYDEIEALSACPELRELTLTKNPIAEDPNYRQNVIRLLPQLAVLDEKQIGKNERAVYQSSFCAEEQSKPSPVKDNMSSVSPINQSNDDVAHCQEDNMYVRDNDDHIYSSPKGEKRNTSFPQNQRGVSKIPDGLQNPCRNHHLSAIERAKDSDVDDCMLAAVLSLIPKMSLESLQIVLQAICERCS